MRILLTGATGFVGSRVAQLLLDRGHQVQITVRSISRLGRADALKGNLAIWEEPMDFVPSPGPDLVVHLAWYAVPGKYIDAPENQECLEASLRLMKKVSCRFVGIGTCFEFDTLRASGPLRDASPTNPTNPYAIAKDSLRHELLARGNAAWLRLFYLYGPGEDPRRRIPSAIRTVQRGEKLLLSTATERRDYLHVDDAARAIAAAALSDLEGCVNVGSGFAPSTAEIMTEIGDLSGRPELVRIGALPTPANEPPLVQADILRLRSIGWRQEIPLERGLRETYAWWAEQDKGATKGIPALRRGEGTR